MINSGLSNNEVLTLLFFAFLLGLWFGILIMGMLVNWLDRRERQ